MELEAYLYDDGEENPNQIDGIPVLCLAGKPCLHTEYPVYIATRGMHHPRIIAELKELGVREIYPVTVGLDMEIRNQFLRVYLAEAGWEFVKIDDLKARGDWEGDGQSRAIYVVRSVFDSALRQGYALAPYEREIQVGAALTKERLYPGIQTDDVGENISARNRQYCELTGLYWIWKNAMEDYIGLVHYRRHFLLPDDWLARVERNRIDVVLPVPLYVAPNIGDNYRERHDATDWDYMMGCLRESEGEGYRKAVDFFKTNLYFPCNMFIMRREVLDELCRWLFPILFTVAEHVGQKKDPYQNRYPGFISERLISFFFEKHRDRYSIAFADKNFLF